MTERESLELQIAVIPTTFRGELARGYLGWKAEFRAKARELLEPLDRSAVGHPDLQAALTAARLELGLPGTTV